MKVHGRCHCGSIEYEADVDAAHVSACHCSDCQALSGSAFRVSVPASAASFRLTGTPQTYIKVADSGNRRIHAFCPACGSPVYSSAIANPTTYSLRVGCLDERAALSPRRQIWCQSSMPWAMDLRDIPQVDRQ
jgi:hypothetical protein